MRRTARVLVAVTSALTALLYVIVQPGDTASASGGGPAAIDSAFVQRLLFVEPLAAFTSIATHRFGPSGRGNDTWFDWSTDFCSAPLAGNAGWTYDFTEPCRRHDFGYRNSKLLDRRYGAGAYWNAASRRRIDRQFLADMKTSCWSRSVATLPSCLGWAYTYYGAVRTFGGP